jgi:hypothetical protein
LADNASLFGGKYKPGVEENGHGIKGAGVAHHWCKQLLRAPNEGGLADFNKLTSLMAQYPARISSDGMFSAVLPSVFHNLLSLTAT